MSNLYPAGAKVVLIGSASSYLTSSQMTNEVMELVHVKGLTIKSQPEGSNNGSASSYHVEELETVFEHKDLRRIK